MKLYYENSGIGIYNADTRDVLPTFQGQQFDLAIWDPPHNCGVPYDVWHDHLPRGQYEEVMAAITLECSRIARNQVCLAPRAHLPFFLSILPGSHVVVMRRPASTGIRNGWQDCYGVALATGRPNRSVPDLWDDIEQPGECDPEHPGHTPEPILRAFAKLYATTNLIDPCCGTGTSLVVAKSLGLSAVGVEISEKYCEVATRRLGGEKEVE